MDLEKDPSIELFGYGHGIDLDLLEQTVIDDVMTEISSNSMPPWEMLPFETVDSISVNIKHNELPLLLDKPIQKAIEATDVGSLLEQFEEASQSLDTPVLPLMASKETCPSEVKENDQMAETPEKKELMSSVLHKLKSSQKPKSTVMLPMMVPAKRGRGRAMTRGHPVAMPASATPRRLQRVIMQNAELKQSLSLLNVDNESEVKVTVQNVKDTEETVTTTDISDCHVEDKVPDTTVNTVETKIMDKSATVAENKVPTIDCEDVDAEICCDRLVIADHDYFKCSSTSWQNAGDDCTMEGVHSNIVDGESSCSAVLNDVEDGELLEEDTHMDESRSRRDTEDDNSQFFDKLPSYCTALSIPRKQIAKTASRAYGRGGITSHDYIERAISPVHDTTVYSKLPDYCSSFTNSTRYDSVTDTTVSKASSGYSSRSPSPADQLPHSESSSGSKSPSRSRSRSPRRRRYRRHNSESSCSGYDSSSSSCSGSSSSSSCSSGRSCSTCSSSSSSLSSRSRSRSPETSWEREQRFRSERSHRNRRSRSRRTVDRSKSRRSAYGSVSRSRSRSRHYRSRSRSRSCSIGRLERDAYRQRRDEERKVIREEEKEQQMKERRIVYVGGLPSSYTRHQLRSKFSRFGEVEAVQLHFREHGDNYGFVTFVYTCDAFAAIERGNCVPGLERFDLCFGGRRQFCDVEYADLDGNKEVEEEYEHKPRSAASCDFDELLRRAKAKIR